MRRQTFEKAPHAPEAGTSSVAASKKKLQAGLLSQDDNIALHVMHVSPKYSLLIPAHTQELLESREASFSS